MSFKVEWPKFDNSFLQSAKEDLERALNKGKKPAIICDTICVQELFLGAIPPALEILEIGDLSSERFRGIFKLSYTGDAHVLLSTKIQANPLSTATSTNSFSCTKASHYNFTRKSLQTSSEDPLIVPMRIKISQIKLSGIIVLAICKQKGITCCFKNDPLESLLVSSTFDDHPQIRSFLQREIEKRIKELLRDDFPAIIHELSKALINKGTQKENNSSSNTGGESTNPDNESYPLHKTPLPNEHQRKKTHPSKILLQQESVNLFCAKHVSSNLGACTLSIIHRQRTPNCSYEKGVFFPFSLKHHTTTTTNIISSNWDDWNEKLLGFERSKDSLVYQIFCRNLTTVGWKEVYLLNYHIHPENRKREQSYSVDDWARQKNSIDSLDLYHATFPHYTLTPTETADSIDDDCCSISTVSSVTALHFDGPSLLTVNSHNIAHESPLVPPFVREKIPTNWNEKIKNKKSLEYLFLFLWKNCKTLSLHVQGTTNVIYKTNQSIVIK